MKAMCGTRNTFAKQEVKWFAGLQEVRGRDVLWVTADEFRKAFPSEPRGFNYDFNQLTSIQSGRTYAIASVGGNARPITRRVVFTETNKPTKCGAMCRNAKGFLCDCSCKGVNHGAGATFSREGSNDIDLTPTEEMAANAKRGLELRRKHGRGGTAVGVARARDISNRKTLSPETVRRMHAFFSRHEKNKAGGEDDAGYIAWMLWSGDAGQGWAKRKVEQMDKSENQRSETYKAIAERLGSAATNDRPGAKDMMAATPHKITLKDKSGVTQTWMVSDKILRDMNATKRYAEATGAKPDYSSVLRLGVRMGEVVLASRPGAKATFAQDARAVAQEILRQLGGGRFMAMVGGKNAMHGMFGGKPGLQVSIGKGAEGGINRLIVTLDPATDTYDMEFWRIGNRGLSTKKVSEASMVYADDLQRVFTDRTKFYTSMSRPGAKAKMGKYRAFVYRGSPRSNVLVKATEWMDSATEAENAAKQIAASYRDKPGFNPGDYFADIAQETPEGAKTIKNNVRFSRPGAKARFADGTDSFLTIKGVRYRIVGTRKDAKGNLVYDLHGTSKTAHPVTYTLVKFLDDQRWVLWGAQGQEVARGKMEASRPGAKDTNAVREGSKISAEDEACLKMMAAADEKVSDKIRTLIAEGKPQKQAVAIALDLKRRGEL